MSSSKDSPSLPSGTDPENALILRTTRGDVIVALRKDIAPGHAERLKLLAREQFYAPPGTPTNPAYSIGNVTQADLSNTAVLTKESYNFALSRLKESVGISVQWLAPLGLFRFSLAVPLNAKRELDGVTWGDQTERFQFSVGQAF